MLESSNWNKVPEKPEQTVESQESQKASPKSQAAPQEAVKAQEGSDDQKPAWASLDEQINNAEQLENKRKEILASIETNWWDIEFSELVKWIWNPKIEQGFNLVAWKIEEKVSVYSLEKKEINNIKIWIISKILKSWKVDDLLNFAEKTAKEIETNGETSVNWEKNLNSGKLINENMADLIQLLESSKNNLWIIKAFLSNPKAIENYKVSQDISEIWELKWNDLKVYMEGFSKGLNNLWDKIWKQAQNIWEFMKNMPDFLKDIFKRVLVSFLGLFMKEYKANEYVDWLFDDFDDSRSINNLKKYWNYLNQKYDLVEWTWEISQLKWVNLTNLDSKELKPFFDRCRENWIDPNSDNFWEKVFRWDKIKWKVEETVEEEVTDPNDSTKKTKKEKKVKRTFDLQFGEINADIFWNNPDFTNFYETLNDENFITNLTKKTEQENQETAKQAEATEKKNQEEADRKAEEQKLQEIENLIGWSKKLLIAKFSIWEWEKKINGKVLLSKTWNNYVIELFKAKDSFNLEKIALLSLTFNKLPSKEEIEQEIREKNQANDFKSIEFIDKWKNLLEKKTETWWAG